MKLRITNKTNEVYEIEAESWEMDRRAKGNAIIVYKENSSPAAYLTQIVKVEEVK